MLANKAALVLAVALVAAVSAPLAHADTITLKGGRSVSGSFYRQGDKYVIEPYQGAAFSVPVGDVTGVVLAPNPNSSQAKGRPWNLLQYRISQSNSLPAIIKMIKQFMASNPHSASLPAAQKDLIQYRQYNELHMIKLGQKWISPPALAAIRAKVDARLHLAVQLYLRGKLSRASQTANSASRLLPTSVHAWVIAGVIDDRLNHLQAARRCFAKALHLAPDNIAALNNAAILNFHIHRQPRSLVLFSKALTIDSGNRQLLDNIYATLRAYKGNRKSPLFTNLRRSFKLADHAMQVRMARRGLYRVGGTWVPRKEYQKLAAKLALFQQKKLAIQASYDSTLLALKAVDAQIRQTNIQIASLQNAIGSLEVQQSVLAYQTGYYDYGAQAALSMNMATLAHAQAQVTKLKTQRISILAGLASIRSQARAFQKSSSGVVLNGRQRMLLPKKFAPTPAPLAVPAHLRPALVKTSVH